MQREVAEEITRVVTTCSNSLEKSVTAFKGKLATEDFERYRKAVAEIITTMVHDILLPIYYEYPDLEKE